MRIIGGEKRGHRLVEWEARGIRPLRESVRAALFDTLGDAVVGADFLDLFAGTGAVGLEALSRGARRATFVDASPAAVRIIRTNLRRLGYEGRAEVIRGDALEAIRRFSVEGRRFDLVFLGAPYSRGLAQTALEFLGTLRPLREGAIVVAELHKKEGFMDSYGELELIRDRTYGDSRLLFFEFVGRDRGV